MHPLSLKSAEGIASKCCHKALADASIHIPTDVKSNLVLGTEIEPTRFIFTIYLPGETPKDAVVYVRCNVDRATSQCEATFYPPAIKYGECV